MLQCLECGNEIGPVAHICPKPEAAFNTIVAQGINAFLRARPGGQAALREERLRRIACQVADAWRLSRQNPRVLNSISVEMVMALEALDEQLLGAADRCQCLAWRMGRSVHSGDCPNVKVKP